MKILTQMENYKKGSFAEPNWLLKLRTSSASLKRSSAEINYLSLTGLYAFILLVVGQGLVYAASRLGASP